MTNDHGNQQNLITKRLFAKLRSEYTWLMQIKSDTIHPIYIQVPANAIVRLFKKYPDAWMFASFQTDLFTGPHALITCVSHSPPPTIAGYTIR